MAKRYRPLRRREASRELSDLDRTQRQLQAEMAERRRQELREREEAWAAEHARAN